MPIDHYKKDQPVEPIKRTPEERKLIEDTRFTGVIPYEANYPGESESRAMYLPNTAKLNYGCMHCEWKKFANCPHGYKTGKGFELKRNVHTAGICKARINYLLSFSRGYSKRPSYTLWRRDFNAGMADVKLKEDWYKLNEVENELLTLEEKKDPEDKKLIQELETKRRTLRGEWQTLWKDLIDMDDKQIGRETVKKIEVEQRKSMNLNDIHSVMRGDAVEAEYKVEEEKK